MNPAVLNYIQSQDTSQNPNMQTQQLYNPFDRGIRAAIESARVSLDMTEKQQDKALRRSMLSFGNAYGNEPRAKGFMGNVGAIARSLSPAIMAHDEVEDASLRENNDLANQILKYQAAEQERQARDEERNWHRQHAENQLAEQKRYHNMMVNKDGISGPSQINGMEIFPIENKRDFSAYAKDKKSLGSILNEVNELEEEYKKFRTNTAGNIFDPMAQGSFVTNKAKDVTGRFFNNKALKDETAERKTLGSKLNKFVISSERALKGGGVMGPRLIELFKEQGIYPDLDNDTPEIFESKLKMLKDEIANSYKAANLSLHYRSHIDPSQVNDFENRLSGNNATPETLPTETLSTETLSTANNETVLMQDQEGKSYEIPANEVNDAIQDGLILVEG